MFDYLLMRRSGLLALFLLLGLSLSAQKPGQDFEVNQKLKQPLETLKVRAGDSIRHYREVLAELEASAKELMGEHRLAKNAFAGATPKVYLREFGPDTGRMVVSAVQSWHVYRKRFLRWAHVGRRINTLKTRNGRKQLFQRYGTKLPDRLSSDKKIKELLNNEIIRHTVFFHEWAKERIDGGASSSRENIIKGIKAFNPRKKEPEPSTSITAGGSIAAEDIYFSYPQHQQANFYPFEFRDGTGKLALRRYPPEDLRVAHKANELWARWKSAKGKVLYTRAFLGDRAVGYRVPTYFLTPGEFYELSIVRSDAEAFNSFLSFYSRKDIGDLIVQDVYHREKKPVVPAQVFFSARFRVSKYGSFFAKTMSHNFERMEGAGTAYQVTMEEPFSPEEIHGLHGSGPQARLSYYGCSPAEEVVNRIYGGAAGTFYAHPSQEYVDYLTRNRDSLNIDSLVAIEFLPYKERSRKYRRLRMVNAEGKRVSAFSRKLPLGRKPVHRECLIFEGYTQPITDAIFNGTAPYQDRSGSLILRDTFAEAAQRIALEVAPLLEARTEEYADLLRQLRTLSPQAGAGKDPLEVVKSINPWYLTDPRNEKQVSLKSCTTAKVNAGYSFPLGARQTTSSSIHVEK